LLNKLKHNKELQFIDVLSLLHWYGSACPCIQVKDSQPFLRSIDMELEGTIKGSEGMIDSFDKAQLLEPRQVF